MRRAQEGDAEPIREIYNEAVATTTATMDMEPRAPSAQAQWMAAHTGRYALLVAEAARIGVVGWASLSRWSDRPAYEGTCESSVYVKDGYRGKGVGRELMEELLKEADQTRFHVVLARVTNDNAASIHLHEALGFARVGVMREVGFKFGNLHDVLILERVSGSGAAPPHRSST